MAEAASHRTHAVHGTTASEQDVHEAYRLYQKNVFKECLEDARLIAKRTRALASDEGGVDVPALALALFEKRCEPWTDYRAHATDFTTALDMHARG